MATRNIKIIGGDPTTQRLVLDFPRKEAHGDDTIKWHISTSQVYSIVSIIPKPGQTDIWVAPPSPKGKHWEGTIKHNPPPDYDYQYSIIWKATCDGDKLPDDPIIAIRPTSVILPPEKEISEKLQPIILAILTLTGLGLLLLWLKKWKKSEK